MEPVTYDAFETDARAKGFDEVLERRWAPSAVVEQHKHPFALTARIVSGEMWLTVGDDVRHMRAGDTFELARDVPHSERYGAEGAVIWVGRRR
jgi:quercetin dioxygenase-like cupin family protein